jgi:hypothetical protein
MQGGVGESMKEEKEGNDLNNNKNHNDNDYDDDNNDILPRRKTALNKLRHDNENENDSSARNKRTVISKQSKNYNNHDDDYDDGDSDDGDSDDGKRDEDGDEDDVKVDMKDEKEGQQHKQKKQKRTQQRVKRHGSYITQHDMWASDSYVEYSQALPSAKPLFNWEHVLLSVQDYADSLLKINSSNITVRYTQYLHHSPSHRSTLHHSTLHYNNAQYDAVIVR